MPRLSLQPVRARSPRLRPHVDYAWAAGWPPNDPRPTSVPPDGHVEVIWSRHGVTVGGHVILPLHVDPIAIGGDLCGLQLKLGHAGQVLGTDAADLVREPVLLGDLWGRDGDLLAEQIADATSPQARVDVLCEGLADHAGGVAVDPLTQHALSELRHPAARVREVGAQVGLSERQLRRRVRDAVGFSPKTLQRIDRLQRFIAGLDRREPDCLARAALDAGYYDQAHLSNEARELTGVSPGELLRESADH